MTSNNWEFTLEEDGSNILKGKCSVVGFFPRRYGLRHILS